MHGGQTGGEEVEAWFDDEPLDDDVGDGFVVGVSWWVVGWLGSCWMIERVDCLRNGRGGCKEKTHRVEYW